MPDKLTNPLKLHVFVCTNRKDKGDFCHSKGAEQLRQELKDWAGKQYGKQVRVNAAGCLGQCENGIAVAIYPAAKWFVRVNSSDLESMKAEITKAFDERNS